MNGVVIGRVLDEENRAPIVNAEVAFGNVGFVDGVTVRTDQDGFFMRLLAIGNSTMTVRSDGFADANVTASVRETIEPYTRSATQEITVLLQPSADNAGRVWLLVVGLLVLAGVIAAVVYYFMLRRKRNNHVTV